MHSNTPAPKQKEILFGVERLFFISIASNNWSLSFAIDAN